jgi:hypothetical protein
VRHYFNPDSHIEPIKKGHELALFLFIYRIETRKQHIDNNNNNNSKANNVAIYNIG